MRTEGILNAIHSCQDHLDDIDDPEANRTKRRTAVAIQTLIDIAEQFIAVRKQVGE